MNVTTTADVLVEPITMADIRPLFPVMRMAEPDLNLRTWVGYCRSVTRAKARARAGIMVARRRGHSLPCGAVHYRLDRNLRHGRLLTVEHCVALDLLYPHAVLAALFKALDEVAAENGCTAIRSLLHEDGADALDKLRVAGHRRDGTTPTKKC